MNLSGSENLLSPARIFMLKMMTGDGQLDQALINLPFRNFFRTRDLFPNFFPDLMGLEELPPVEMFDPDQKTGIRSYFSASIKALPNSSAASGPEPVINFPSCSTGLPV